ncbi:MAG TPA: SRPBCC family protein [Paracoccaceae bacterium]|nr:SRPBCC family protein [Paracoccaceae bacterium]
MPAPTLHALRDPDYVHVIYILASPEKVWAALTDGTSERAWWAGTRHASAFKAGDPVVFQRAGAVDVRGEILESDPPRRLVYTFHIEGADPMHDEGPSVVTYELRPNGDATMLKVVHGNFPQGSTVRPSIEQGWPAILSALKSALEGGRTPEYARWGECEAKAESTPAGA